MFPSFQPLRPKIHPSHSSSPPLNQQPTRTFSDAQTSQANLPMLQYQAPRNQMEAMPPSGPTTTTTAVTGHPQQQLLSALRHPVFFTNRFTKAPPGVSTGAGTWATPVSTGYVYNDGVQRSVGGTTRL